MAFNLKSISNITPYSDDWWLSRLGKLTSSRISCILGDRGIGEGGMTYIRSKVAEKLTGKSSERNVTTEAILFGISNEPLSIANYKEKYNVPFILTNKHLVYNELFASTPDFIVINSELGDSYDAETGETKSYQTFATHMEHCECNTPADIKKIDKALYWQVISQMAWSGVLKGNATFYHPDFAGTKLESHRVQFKKIELIADFKFLATRMEEATTIYNNLLNRFS